MSATSARAFSKRLKENGGCEFRARLSPEARTALADLAAFHRLDRREVIERLVLGVPLSDRGGLGLSPDEVRAYEAMGGTL